MEDDVQLKLSSKIDIPTIRQELPTEFSHFRNTNIIMIVGVRNIYDVDEPAYRSTERRFDLCSLEVRNVTNTSDKYFLHWY